MLLILLSLAQASAATSLRIIERVDPINDSKSFYAVVGDENQHLAFGCDDVSARSVRVVARFNNYIGDSKPGILMGGTDVQYRFDKRPPVAVRWYSHDREVSAEAEITRPARFIQEMKDSRTVYLRATNYDGDSFDMGFSYENATPIIQQVLTACGLNADGTRPKTTKAR